MDIATGTPNLADAKRIVREELKRSAKNPAITLPKETLEDVAKTYEAAPNKLFG